MLSFRAFGRAFAVKIYKIFKKLYIINSFLFNIIKNYASNKKQNLFFKIKVAIKYF